MAASRVSPSAPTFAFAAASAFAEAIAFAAVFAIAFASSIVGLAVLTPSVVLAEPALSPAIPIDHGVRFHDRDDHTFGTALGVRDGELVFTYGLAYSGIKGFRRTSDGEEIDLAPRFLGPSGGGVYSRFYALSSFDQVGWKLVYSTGQSIPGDGLRIREHRSGCVHEYGRDGPRGQREGTTPPSVSTGPGTSAWVEGGAVNEAAHAGGDGSCST
ncbi:MAG: hypothetical protein R3E97_24405 [Candidatus Eisenbacteria bacterium]